VITGYSKRSMNLKVMKQEVMPLAMRKQRAQKTRTVVLLVLTILVIGSILEFITDCRK
jgi:hypothetical protein